MKRSKSSCTCFSIRNVPYTLALRVSHSGSVNVQDIAAKVPEVQELVEAARERLTETVVETDDELTMKYLEGEEISNADFAEAVEKSG